MKKTFYDEVEDKNFELEIPDELYRKAYEEDDMDALYEVAVMLELTGEVSISPIIDMMYEAWDDGNGSELAGEWLRDNLEDDGKYDAWA